MKNLPIITIYITNYNYGTYIKKAINSALEQSYKNIDLIIIDDASTDFSKRIIKKYEKYDRVRIIYNKPKKGLIKSSNIAVRASKGEFVLRLDADDYLKKDCLKILYSKIKKNNNVAMVYSDYYEIDSNDNVLIKQKQIDINSISTLKDRPVLAACCLIRKSALFSVNLYDEKFNRQDGYDLWYKLIKEFNFKYVSKPLFFYRKHLNNLTSNKILLYKTRSQILKKYAYEKIKKLNIIGLVPVRSEKIEKNIHYLKKLKKKPILFHTIDETIKSTLISKIILTSPDKKLLLAAKKKYNNKINYHLRKKEHALLNTDLKVGVLDALKKIKKKIDIIIILDVEYPFKKYFYIEQAISKLILHNCDRVISSVFTINSNYYKYSKNGIQLISNDKLSALRYERKTILKEAGGIAVIKYKAYKTNKVRKISNIIIDNESSKSINKYD